MIVVLSGGVGGSRFVSGVVRCVPPKDVTVICNVADDEQLFYGVRVSTDLDIMTYTLAGQVDTQKGWGLHETRSQ